MKYIYSFAIIMMAFMLVTSCENELDQDVSMNVSAEQTNDVTTVGDTVVVTAGSPVNFLFSGTPDYITFYSGEIGSKYAYRNRTEIALEDIVSSTLSFKLYYQYGALPNLTGNPDATSLASLFISTKFSGISKNNFTADSTLVHDFQWNHLVEDDKLPQTIKSSESKADAYSIDMSAYATDTFTLAIRYWGKDVPKGKAQPKLYISGMKIENVMSDGTVTTLYASDFGMTPINMMCHHDLSDQKAMKNNREYGSVTNSISGIWNLTGISSGSFFIHSSNPNTEAKYSWLVSDHIKTNACTPDRGVAIKSTNFDLDKYSYTYETPGIYKATFVATNANYKHQSQILKEVNVKVIPANQ